MKFLHSSRAERYLRSLEREPPVPMATVDTLLRAQGWWCEAWVEFHRDYAGYVEPVGCDKIIWGIMRESGVWVSEPTIEADGPSDDEALIACADCHPSYDYCLDLHGGFTGLGGGGAASVFGVKVERNALLWSLDSNFNSMSSATIAMEDSRNLLKSGLYSAVPEASDEFATYYQSGNSVLVVGTRGHSALYQAQ